MGGKCASTKSYWESSSLRLGFSRDIGKAAGSHRGFDPRHSVCLD